MYGLPCTRLQQQTLTSSKSFNFGYLREILSDCKRTTLCDERIYTEILLQKCMCETPLHVQDDPCVSHLTSPVTRAKHNYYMHCDHNHPGHTTPTMWPQPLGPHNTMWPQPLGPHNTMWPQPLGPHNTMWPQPHNTMWPQPLGPHNTMWPQPLGPHNTMWPQPLGPHNTMWPQPLGPHRVNHVPTTTQTTQSGTTTTQTYHHHSFWFCIQVGFSIWYIN